MSTSLSRNVIFRGQPRRTEVAAWSGGDLRITVCKASKQIVLVQGGKEVSFPVARWQAVEDTVLKAITPAEKPNG